MVEELLGPLVDGGRSRVLGMSVPLTFFRPCPAGLSGRALVELDQDQKPGVACGAARQAWIAV